MELPDDPEAFAEEGDYLVELERLLLDELDDGMLLAELDGYVAGLCISGDPVPPERWIAEVWNGGSAPIDDPVTALRLIGLIIRHRDRVGAALEVPGTYAPIFDLDPDTGATFALTWTAGFDVAMRIAPTGFNRLRASSDPAIIEAMAAICRLIAADARRFGETDADYDALDALADERLASWVEALHAGKLDWRNAGTKVGRNDLCPCGSGRKYKKCCAA